MLMNMKYGVDSVGHMQFFAFQIRKSAATSTQIQEANRHMTQYHETKKIVWTRDLTIEDEDDDDDLYSSSTIEDEDEYDDDDLYSSSVEFIKLSKLDQLKSEVSNFREANIKVFVMNDTPTTPLEVYTCIKDILPDAVVVYPITEKNVRMSFDPITCKLKNGIVFYNSDLQLMLEQEQQKIMTEIDRFIPYHATHPHQKETRQYTSRRVLKKNIYPLSRPMMNVKHHHDSSRAASTHEPIYSLSRCLGRHGCAREHRPHVPFTLPAVGTGLSVHAMPAAEPHLSRRS